MSRRSKEWQESMEKLSQREKTLRSELEFKAVKLEKRGLIILALSGVAAVGLIGVFSVRKTRKKKLTKATVGNSSKSWRLGGLITEKILVAGLTLIFKKLGELDFAKKDKPSEKSSEVEIIK